MFRRLAKDSAVYGGADFITKILYFFAFPIIAGVLSPTAFGALELIFTATALLGLALNCGLNNAVQYYYWEKNTTPEMRPSIVTTGFFAQMILGIVAVIIGIIAIPLVLPLIHTAKWPLSWVGLVAALVVMVLSMWTQYALDVIRLHFAPWRFFVLAMTSRVIAMAFGLVAVVYFDMGIDGLLAAQALVLIFVMPLALWMIRSDFQPASFDIFWFKELVRFGHPFIFVGLAYWLFGSMDRWMLAVMSSVEDVGIYSVAFRFASVVLFVSGAFGQAWSPVAIKIRADYPERYRVIYGQVLLLLLFIMLTVGGGVALFSGEVIGHFMPAEYRSSALPLTILCFSVILQSTLQVTAIGISLEKKTYLFARLAWAAVGANFLGNWILIPPFGAAGSAGASLISYIVLTCSYLYSTQRLHPMVIQWMPLVTLLFLGVVVGVFATTSVAEEFDLLSVAWKLALASICLAVGWKLIPMHSIKEI